MQIMKDCKTTTKQDTGNNMGNLIMNKDWKQTKGKQESLILLLLYLVLCRDSPVEHFYISSTHLLIINSSSQ